MFQTAFIMKMDLEVDVSFILEPVKRPGGNLMAMELLSRFFVSGEMSSTFFPPELLFRKATPDEKKKLFSSQLDAVETQSVFFNKNNILCSLNIDECLADFICHTPDIRRKLINMPFIRLEISERFPALNDATRHPLLTNLSRDFGLWLDDFGSGNASMAAVHSGLFETVKIDKAFFWKHAESPLWPGILREVRRDVSSIVVEGIETERQTEQLRDSVEGLQGYLFPPVPLSDPGAALLLPDTVHGAANIPGSIVSLRHRPARRSL
ncbi:EAL domain-containing protein [Pantoea ananatis]|uniref:EAL domain-containing protein n=1 Tax=Pantoea ananas TaxID=553 RepID=UPI000FEC7975|nr:EAL domain-containing protein [Pantoea ananatis]QAB29128.1 EAL domain-containing protein [Pantoea ananatis]